MTPIDRREPDSASDADLVARLAEGDREAFALLFRRHERSVHRFALHMTGLQDVADDVTQDVFVALARGARRYRAVDGALGTYLYGIARHLVLQREKKRRLRQEVELGVLGERDAPAPWQDPVDGLAQARRVALLRRAILCLPAHYREVIVLCEVHGLSYDEAAAIVGCPIGTIRSRLNRARRQLIERCRASPGLSDSAEAPSPMSWLWGRRPPILGSDQ